jgi:catechol 2,3-dioxygenase-like lactoylglutathione lyase family enzyme
MTDTDPRPSVWIGHQRVVADDVAGTTTFWETVGMRIVHQDVDFAVLELRGGTHLVVAGSTASPPDDLPFDIPFDVMVDDLDETWARLRDAGLEPTEIKPGRIHSSFTINDPDGRPVTVNSSHIVGPV